MGTGGAATWLRERVRGTMAGLVERLLSKANHRLFIVAPARWEEPFRREAADHPRSQCRIPASVLSPVLSSSPAVKTAARPGT